MTLEEKIDKILEQQTILNTILLGADGDEGLVGDVNGLRKEVSKLKKAFWLFVGIVVGSGGLIGGQLADLLRLPGQG
jgi:hypothetical protein